MRVRKDENEDFSLQMAPLIDCVFLLLIFFLVAATLKKAHKELGIQLPHAAAGEKTHSPPTTLIIEIARDGAVYIDKQRMTPRLLQKRLHEAAQEAPERQVRVDGDRLAPFQHFVRVMSLCRLEGLTKVGVRLWEVDDQPEEYRPGYRPRRDR
jgi:biopolymer transport protein ExbD